MNGIIYKWYHKYTYLSVNTVSLSGGESKRLVQQPTSQQHEWKCEIFSTGTSRNRHRRDVGCCWVNEPPCSVCNYSTVFGVRFLYSYMFFSFALILLIPSRSSFLFSYWWNASNSSNYSRHQQQAHVSCELVFTFTGRILLSFFRSIFFKKIS